MPGKLIVICGPTASGKSDLAVALARTFKGEIISADSRQVYKGLDVGSGKITKKEMRGVPHHLLDVASPKRQFTVAQFQKLAVKKIEEIQGRTAVPFLVGGTGFYIQSVADGIVIPDVRPNLKLRKKLAKKSAEELFLMLKKLDPARAKTIDAKNPRRLIRAIEIITATKHPIKPLQSENYFNVLYLGIKKEKEELKNAITKRLRKRLKGIIAEVKKLRRNGLSWRRLEDFGLEYRYTAYYLQGKINKEEMVAAIQKESEQYAKRQMTWFKRDPRIQWINPSASSGLRETEKLIRKFL